jgi:hypothetical protein
MRDWIAGGTDSPGSGTTRRRLLRGLVAGGLLAGGAGCITSVGRGPDPDVVWERADPELDEVAAEQEITVSALVVNVGDPGDVEVITETRLVGEERPVDTHSQTLDMKRDEQREISYEMVVSPAPEILEARAEPVE